MAWRFACRRRTSVVITSYSIHYTKLYEYLPIFMRDELGVSIWLAAAALTILEGAGVAGIVTLEDVLESRNNFV